MFGKGLATVIAAIVLAIAGAPMSCPGQEEAWKRQAELREREAARLLERARARAASGAFDAAADLCRTIVRRYRKSPSAAEAQFQLARILEEAGNYRAAFESYQALIDYFRASPRFLEAIASQMQISRRFLEVHRLRAKRGEEERRRPNNLPEIAEVASMFSIIVTNARHSEVAPEAQYLLGVCHQIAERYKDAREAHETLLERYPASAVADDAAFQLAYLDLLLSRRLNAESSLRRRADLAFRDFLVRHPESPKAPLARHCLRTLMADEARELSRLAEYYKRAGNTAAAEIYEGELAKLRATSSAEAPPSANSRGEDVDPDFVVDDAEDDEDNGERDGDSLGER